MKYYRAESMEIHKLKDLIKDEVCAQVNELLWFDILDYIEESVYVQIRDRVCFKILHQISDRGIVRENNIH